MTNIHHINERNTSDDSRLDEASEWLAKLDRGLTKSEEQALKQWLAQSYKNVEVLLEVAKLWDKNGRSQSFVRSISTNTNKTKNVSLCGWVQLLLLFY